jgi:hypothetical protein
MRYILGCPKIHEQEARSGLEVGRNDVYSQIVLLSAKSGLSARSPPYLARTRETGASRSFPTPPKIDFRCKKDDILKGNTLS